MKNKKIKIYILIALIAITTGCGKTNSQDAMDIFSQSTVVNTEEAVSSQSTNIKEETSAEDNKIQDSNILKVFQLDNKIVCLEKDGNVEIIPVELENDNQVLYRLIYDSNNLYYSTFEYIDNAGYEKIYYIDKNQDSIMVDVLSTKMNYELFIKNNKLYSASFEYTSDFNGMLFKELKTYSLNENGEFDSVVEKNDLFAKMFENLYKFMSLDTINDQLSLFDGVCKYNSDSKSIRLYDKDFNLLSEHFFDLPENINNFMYTDGRYIIVSNYSDDDFKGYVLDTDNDSVKELDITLDQLFNIKGINKGLIIFFDQTSKEYGVSIGDFYALDLSTGQKRKLFTKEYEPGAQNGYEEPSNFYFEDNLGYFTKGNFSGNYLYKFDMTQMSDPVEYKKIGNNSIGDFGTVEYISKKITYKDTDELIYGCYCEVFQFTKDYPAKDRINLYLKEELERPIEGFDNEAISYQEDYDPEFPFECTLDYSISKVFEIGTELVSVNVNGYDYSGGAHGMPFKNQYLFNINSGEIVEFNSVYNGNEDDFKVLVANHALEYYKEHTSDFFGYDNDVDAYQAFFDDASLSMWKEFDVDGIKIIYSPYQFGPYSSGYIEYVIPYNEIGINIK